MSKKFTASNGRIISPGLVINTFHILDSDGEDMLNEYNHLNLFDMDALREFFAGGERFDKPSRNAKRGQIWAITYKGEEYAGALDGDLDFALPFGIGRSYIHIDDEEITEARLLWEKKEDA